ncbi:MAG: DUF3298 and DUF4163 domain-containing protein [Peptostreptococcaceae bacterium]|jgi:hypothetical protein|nr:DUF3298 and DUF4163 domain-containing protein [Peptostreptococcaceae bacterium]
MIKKKYKNIIAASLVFITIFTCGVNMNEAFANTMDKIPVISSIAKILTFKDYEIKEDVIEGNVKIPKIEDLKDKKLENKINDEIKKRVELRIEESKQRAEEYKEAYLATGGTIDDYRPIKFEVNYELKLANEDILSFMVYEFESLGSAYTNTYFYNINTNTSKELSLKDLMGDNYIKIANEKVRAYIKEQIQSGETGYFTDDAGFESIKENQKFYINKNKEIVIVFDKYEIACGAMGQQDIVVGTIDEKK